MQLNRAHRERIVTDIMADIPRKSYGGEIAKLVQEEAYKLMPAEVRAVYDNEETRPFLYRVLCSVSGPYAPRIGHIYWTSTAGSQLFLNKWSWNVSNDLATKKLLENIQDRLTELLELSEQQHKARSAMQKKLNTMLRGIRTLKQAKTLLEPELHKYLPSEPPKDPAQRDAQTSTALVPYVVANLREMGWPKDQEPKTGEAV